MTNKLVLENLKFRPVRSALSVVAIALEVTMMLTIVGLGRGTLADVKQRARGVGADIFIRPRNSNVLSLSSATIPEKFVPWLSRQPHITLVVGAVVYPLQGLSSITGIDLDKFNRMSGGLRYLSGGPPRKPDDIVVDRYFALQNKLQVGSTLTLLNRPWRVSGIFEEGKLARIVVPMGILQDLTGTTGKLSQIYVKVDRPENIQPVIAYLKSKLEGYPIYSAEELLSLISATNIPMLSAFTGVVIGVSVVVGFLVVFLSMYTAVLERTREVGVLKALGASQAFVLGILLRETAVLGVAGSVLGIAASYASRYIIHNVASSWLSQQIVPDWWPIAAAIAVGGALLGAAYPGWRAARQDPIEALSYE